MKKGYLIWMTLCLIGALALGVTGTVMGKEAGNREEQEIYLHNMERAVEKDVRQYLNENAYENCGVMLTRVVDARGDRTYTITVHHQRIDRLSEPERQKLREQLLSVAEEGFLENTALKEVHICF